MKQKAILGVHVGELGWEILRFAPHVLWTKYKRFNGEVKLIILTRPDRFDLYGQQADILEPLIIKGDFTKYQSDCFRLTGYPIENYHALMEYLVKKYSREYEIVAKIQPAIDRFKYTEKQQLPLNQMMYKFKPRSDNFRLLDEFISNDKPCITISPRYRKQATFRNWPYWHDLYELIINNGLTEKINFIVCGKPPEYIPPKSNKIYNINNIKLTENSSLIGLTIASIKRSIFTVGSQSGIPNLSNLLGTPTIQWGNEKTAHTKTYNVKNTETIFIEDKKFVMEPCVIFDTIKERIQ